MQTEESSFSRRPAKSKALILTAWVDEEDMRVFHRLRARFFPRAKSFVSAHITLFHDLSGLPAEGLFARINERIRSFEHPLLDRSRGFALSEVERVFSLGKGVAYGLEGSFLIPLRNWLADDFGPYLKRQDQQVWRNPHITVQNKVSKQRASDLARHLSFRFEPCTIRIWGVELWRYDQGPWTALCSFPFA